MSGIPICIFIYFPAHMEQDFTSEFLLSQSVTSIDYMNTNMHEHTSWI